MRKILTVATVGLVSATVVAPTFSAASSTADWSNDVLVGDTIYVESIWTDSLLFDGASTISSEDADKINDALFSETDGIEFTITQTGDVYVPISEGSLSYKATGETNVNTPVTDIRDVILTEDSIIDVEMNIIQTPTTTDLENLATLSTDFGFSDDQLSSVLTDGQTVTTTTTDTDGNPIAETTLSRSPIATTDETTTSGDQEIAYTGLEK